MDDVGAMLARPFGAEARPARLVSMGLLWLGLNLTLVGIPLAAIALTGWMLKATDSLRSGRPELPPAGFHLRRGAPLFLVQLAYLALLLVATAIPILVGLRVGGVGGGLLA